MSRRTAAPKAARTAVRSSEGGPVSGGSANRRQAVNPPQMYETVSLGFSHAVLQTGGRTLHLAGQTAWNEARELVGAGDLVAQTRQVLANLRRVLAACGATPGDVVRLRTYVVNHSPDMLGPLCAEIVAFYEGAAPAPNTLVGVQALALPEFLIEIEATAVVADA